VRGSSLLRLRLIFTRIPRYKWEHYECANCGVRNWFRSNISRSYASEQDILPVSGKIRSHKELWSIPVSAVDFHDSKITEGASKRILTRS
jgi:hypothetical protein